MPDLTKFSEIYKEFKDLTSDEFLQLILNAETKEERDFFAELGDYFLQREQQKVIDKGLF